MTSRHERILSAFDRRQIPTVTLINQAKTPLGVRLDDLAGALQKFLDRCFVPVWGTPARVVNAKKIRKRAWALVFLDDADSPDALGYHDLTPEGLPLSRIFVRPTLKNGDEVSVTACHELVEMLVDPAINLCSTGPRNTLYAYEVADAVEEETFPIDGIAMSDFVYPAWFEEFRKPGSTQFDHLDKLSRPFQLLPNGYIPIFRRGRWSEIYGSKAKARRFAKEDRRGHRSTIRARRTPLRPSVER
jgi:hypothetical protein